MDSQTPVAYLKLAASRFPTMAAFARALTAQAKIPPDGKPITRSHIENWIRRGNGVPARLAPDVEVLSGVAVELLRPDVNWHVVRGRPAPPLRKRKTDPDLETTAQQPPEQSAAGADECSAAPVAPCDERRNTAGAMAF